MHGQAKAAMTVGSDCVRASSPIETGFIRINNALDELDRASESFISSVSASLGQQPPSNPEELCKGIDIGGNSTLLYEIHGIFNRIESLTIRINDARNRVEL